MAHDSHTRSDRLLEAVLAIAADLDLETVLGRIVEVACDLVDARYGALGVVASEGRQLSAFVHRGLDDEIVAEIGELPSGRGILGLLIDEPVPLRLDDLQQHPFSAGFPPGHPPMHAFLGVPIQVGGHVFGNLYLTEKRDGSTFSQEDEDLVVGLGGAAGVAIFNARLHEDVRRLSLIEERERIGRDLHDTVVQRLFATGLSLQATIRRCEDRPELAERLEQAVDEIDRTVKEIRATIFALQSVEEGSGARARVLRVAEELTSILPAAPRVTFEGPVDLVVEGRIADQLVPSVREMLTNVAKHARARTVELDVSVTDGCVHVRAVDDGRGIDPTASQGFGLRNLRERAQNLGGELIISAREDGEGAVVDWRVPIG